MHHHQTRLTAGRTSSHKTLPYFISEMTTKDAKKIYVNGFRSFQIEDDAHGRTSIRFWSNQSVVQRIYHPESKYLSLVVWRVNAAILIKGTSEETALMEHGSVGRETRFRGNFVRMFKGKVTQNKILDTKWQGFRRSWCFLCKNG